MYHPIMISKSNKAVLKIKSEIENKEFKRLPDSIEIPNNLNLKIKVIKPDGSSESSFENKFSLDINKSTLINKDIEIKNPSLWSASNAQSYLISAELWRGDSLIDETEKELGIYSINAEKNSILFNGTSFQLKGVTYIPSL